MNAAEKEKSLLKELWLALKGASSDKERARIIKAAEKKTPGLGQLMEAFGTAVTVVGSEVPRRRKEAKKIIHMLHDKNIGASDFAAMEPVHGLTVLALCSMLDRRSAGLAKKISAYKEKEVPLQKGRKKGGDKRAANYDKSLQNVLDLYKNSTWLHEKPFTQAATHLMKLEKPKYLGEHSTLVRKLSAFKKSLKTA